MKIRIKGNTLRLRLSQSELTDLETTGQVADQIHFPTSPLIYTLKCQGEGEIAADFNGKEIRVLVPTHQINEWVNSDLVGFSAQIQLPDQEPLSILVEKDFKCLVDRPGEDESNLLDNPDS